MIKYNDILQNLPGGLSGHDLKHVHCGQKNSRRLHRMGIDPVAFRRWCHNSLLAGRAEIGPDGMFALLEKKI